MIRHKGARSAQARQVRHHDNMGISTGRRLLSGFVVALLAGTAGAATAVPAMAAELAAAPIAQQGIVQPANAPGAPGTPSAPVVVFQEDFENTAGTTPVMLEDYAGVDGQAYTAASGWLTNCNGVIVNYGIPYTELGNCQDPRSSANLRQLAYALGAHSSGTAETNDAVSAYTENNPGANQVEFETVNPVSLASASGRFLTFSVDAAAKNCGVSGPQYQFSFLTETGVATPGGGAINACSSANTVSAPTVGPVAATDISVDTYTSNGSVLFDGSSLGIRMTNANGSGVGNDAAFDNIRILDVTPQLDKGFSPARVPVGGTSTLTLTVTNTSELAAKSGWAFTDQLPAGLTVATPASLGGTCVADVTAPAGAGSIAVANGALAAGTPSCTITVAVTSSTADTYTNGADNITGETGIDLPADSTVEFYTPAPFVCTSNAGGMLFQYPTGPTLIQDVNMVTGEYDTAQTLDGVDINAVGYNVLDDYIYGWDLTVGSQSIVRVASDGTVTRLGTPAGGVTGSIIGDVDADGQYWVINGTTWNKIDLAPGSSTYMTVVDSGMSAMPAGLTTPGADWAFVPGAGDYLYSVGQDVDGQAQLVRFDSSTGVRDVVGSLGLGAGAWTFGAVYADANGYLYASNNATGTIYRIDVDDVSAEVFAQGPASGSNDGARCAASPILLDFGDAPASYGTALNADGARHGVPAYDEAAHTAPLMLGAAIDPEDNGRPGASALGDDDNGVADEDGVAGPIIATVGDQTVVTVSATNDTDEAATLAGWIDLDGNGTFDASELVTVAVPAGSGAADYRLTFPAVTTFDATFARFRLFNGTVASPLPAGAASAGEVEDYAVTVIDRDLAIVKSSDFTADSRPGDTITYTITATNTGTADYTAADPAVVLDDLAGVLDDAEYNRDATATSNGSDAGPVGFLPDSFLSWSGAIAAGDSVTITYTVTLAGGGDGAMRNVAWEPNVPPAPGTPPSSVPTCDPVNGDGTDATTGEACGFVENALPKLTIDKIADRTDLPADGDTVTYTVTVSNVGDGDYTAAAPATVTDDLSKVLDDGTFGTIITPATGASQNGDELTWSGPLAAGETVVIEYTVVYDADAPGGDHILVNAACVPADEAMDPAAACGVVQVPAAALTMSKSVDPANGTAVTAGQEVTYTLSFENTGQALATVDALDDLTGVLDDAVLTGAPIGQPGLVALQTGQEIEVTGVVPVGETLTVTYTVTVNAYADQTDHVLGNVLSNGDGTCPPIGCAETSNPIRHFSVTKASDAAADVQPGDTVTYTVVLTNDGAADYTAGTPAGMTDDLTDVLDDATYNGDAIAVASDGSVVPAPGFTAPQLTWSGAVATGKTVTITYSVTLTNRGDHDLVNVATPACAPGVLCDPPTEVTTLLPSITPTKTSDPATGEALQAGDVVSYTLSWTNDGQATGPLDSTDDLSGVLDDAELTSAPTASSPDVDVVLDDAAQTLRVTGELAPGATVTVTYQATIRPDGDRGDNIAGNVLTPDVPPFFCADDDSDCDPFVPPATSHPLGELDDWKTVDPASGTTVRPGQEMTYTLHFANTGEADVDVSRDDALTMVLDDATVSAAPTASDPALSVSAIVDGRFTVTGTLAAGQDVTVTYTVTVNDDGARGDDQLGNFLVDEGAQPPVDCTPIDDQRPDCTINFVSNVVVTKSADPASGTDVAYNQNVTYTLTFRNVGTNAGAAAVPVDYTDHLVDVLDDAVLAMTPIPSDHRVQAALAGDTIRITGAVATGEVVTVTYTVTPKAYDEQGDHVLGNVVAVTGTDPVCAPDSPLCTTHDITPPPPLATTGGEIDWSIVLAALALLVGGAGLMLVTSRRRRGGQIG